MADAGGGGKQDPRIRHEIKWISERERFAAIATGLRVIKSTSGTGVQIQILEFGVGGSVRVSAVVPGDRRHLALYRTLIKPESEWGTE